MKSKPNYTKSPAQCMLAVIECVYSMGNLREMEDTLGQLQQYGGAQVIEKFSIKESFDDACKILDRRALREETS